MFKTIQTKTMFYMVAFASCILVVSCYLMAYGIEHISKSYKEESMRNEARLAAVMVEKAFAEDPVNIEDESQRERVLHEIREAGIEADFFLINDRRTTTGYSDDEFPYDFAFKEPVVTQNVYKNQKNYVAAVARIDESIGWYVVVEQLYSDAYGVINLMKTITITLLVLMLIMLWNLAKSLSAKIQGPIRALADAAVNVASGDISRGIETSENGELSDIAESFNAMLNKLKSTMQQVLDKSGEAASMAEIMEYVEETYDNLPGGIIGINLIGEVTTFNKTAEELTGLQSDQIIGLNVDNPMPIGIANIVNPLKKCMHEGSIQLKTLTDIKNTDGEVIPLLYSISIQFGTNDEVIGAICVFRRIEDIKKFEESANRVKTLESLGEMAASMAHEIRNPLTSISGYAQLLKIDNEDSEEVDIILHEAGRLNDILNRFLTFARPKTPDLVPSDVNKVVEYAASLIRGNLPENVELVLKLEEIPMVMMDKNLFEPVILNLLLNSIQALPDGGLIQLKTHYNSRRKMVSINVKDNGIGIPPENSARLFDPFFTTKSKGTGLGLPIAVRTVEAHGGVIEVESVVGEMTQFTVWLQALNEQ